MKTIVTVVGARPQFIKAATVSRAFRSLSGVRELLVHTGQHYDDDMSDVFFRELEIGPPDRYLGIGSGPHGSQTGRMLEALESVLVGVAPAAVLVYGDTNSTLAAALAAAKLQIPIAHVEAGLRSFNRRMPEEVNRVLTDHVASYLFAPTTTAVENLAREGIATGVHLVGDVMYDAALFYAAQATAHGTILQDLALQPKGYLLATIHRAENTDEPARLGAIFDALTAVSDQIPVLLPLHPRTRAALRRDGRLEDVQDHLQLIAPVGYLDMVTLEQHARLVITDSGGVQKEAFFYHVPCVTLRDETEWVELIDLGWNRLAPPSAAALVQSAIAAALGAPPGKVAAPFGDGHAADVIVSLLAGALL